MINDESKTRRQIEAIYKWRAAKGIGTLNFVPRFGKTRCGVIAVEEVNKKQNSDFIIVAVAPNDITHKNLVRNLPSNVIVTTLHKVINDLENFKKMDIGLLIVDEIHKFLNNSGTQILSLKSKFRLGLTGDRLASKDKLLLMEYNFPVIDIITEDEALENNWISQFVEYNLPVEIEDYKKERYAAYSEKIHEITSTYNELYRRMNTLFNNKIFTSDIDLIYALYSGIKFTYPNSSKYLFIPPDAVRNALADTMGWKKDLDLSIDFNERLNLYFNPSKLHEIGKIFNDIIRDRNDLIINSKNKIDMVLEIIKRNPCPTIIFNESTNMASLIAQALGDEAIEYHSAVESRYIINPDTGDYVRHKNGNPIKFGASRLKQFAISGINEGLFKYLCTAKALNEGVDIPILSQVITTGGSTNPSTHFQRVSRGKTIYTENLSKVTTIINVYIADFTFEDKLIVSRDASKLRIRQKNSTVFWVDTIDEIFANID